MPLQDLPAGNGHKADLNVGFAAAAELAEEVPASGHIDGFLLNASYAAIRPVAEIDANFFDAMTAANLKGPVLQFARPG